jgi:hypothetical protein
MEHGNGADLPQPQQARQPLFRQTRVERKATLHPYSSWHWGSLEEVAPEYRDVARKIEQEIDGVIHALRIDDPDGESHIVLFSDEAKKALVTKMTGVVLAT